MTLIAAVSFNNNMYGDFLAVGVITVVSAFIPLTKSDAVYTVVKHAATLVILAILTENLTNGAIA